MLRRLALEQPDSFEFTPANIAWAEQQIAKYPEGRQASAVIPLLWRAQEQEGWVSKPAIETVAEMLGMAYIRVLEVASFYFMFQLQPVGSVAHVQVCGTLSCMICGAEDLIGVCKDKIAANAHEVSADGKFSWEEVECLGACSNAPMVQIGKDFYEDLTAEKFAEILDAFARGEVPTPGPQNGRYAAEPLSGLTSLAEHVDSKSAYNMSADLAVQKADTIKRIQGDEVDPFAVGGAAVVEAPAASEAPAVAEEKPASLTGARDGQPDDLKQIKGVGPKLEAMLNEMGYFHFDQIAAWTDAQVAWADQNLVGFKGRVSRDEWVAQAKILASGGETAFSKRVGDGDVY